MFYESSSTVLPYYIVIILLLLVAVGMLTTVYYNVSSISIGPYILNQWFLSFSTHHSHLLLLLLLLSRFSRVRLCATPWQPTRLPRPWDSPGKNTGVGCHFLLQCVKVKSESEVAQSCPTFATPWTAAYQAPPSMGFSRQEYWSGVPLPSPHSHLRGW